jgi:5-formyltetrahydrofolate cyclo-ligase
MTKSELRKSFLAKRQSITSSQRNVANAQIAANFFERFDLSEFKVLHCFISIERFGEVDTRPIFQRVWSEFPKITTVVPRIDHETEELESLLYGSDIELQYDRWQIGEPIHDNKVPPDQIDIVLIPLLCYDRVGHRVGYGKGYYDRFLARCRPDCQKIGLSMFPPIDKIDDAHEGDIRLDACITPSEVISFSNVI